MDDPTQSKYVIRMPMRLHRELKRKAKQDNTSMNRKIVDILTSELASKPSTQQTLEDLIKRLENNKVI